MEEGRRCVHCLLGTIVSGVCTQCGKQAIESPQRPGEALPAHCLLQNQYELGRVLGSGGFGITYLAWDYKNRRRVAVKELFPRQAAGRTGDRTSISVMMDKRQYFQHVKKRFCEEAQALYELRDVPEVINVYHLFEANETAYYVMEFLEGEDLKHYLLKHGTMKWEQMLNPLRMVLRALYALHGKGLIHRDISPDNIFLIQGGAKLIDFGSVRNYSDSHFTAILKERFAPYEQFAENGKQGPWTDIYSLSVTLYYALSGALPPKATDRMVAWKTQPEQPDLVKPIDRLCPKLPSNVAQALHKGMAVAAEQRPGSIQEFTELLFGEEDVLNIQAPKSKERCIRCIDGLFKGRVQKLYPGIEVMVGRGFECVIKYPDNSKGVSRHQCSLMVDDKGIAYVRDDQSTYGTYLDTKRLKPMKWYPINDGNLIKFAKEVYSVV